MVAVMSQNDILQQTRDERISIRMFRRVPDHLKADSCVTEEISGFCITGDKASARGAVELMDFANVVKQDAGKKEVAINLRTIERGAGCQFSHIYGVHQKSVQKCVVKILRSGNGDKVIPIAVKERLTNGIQAFI